MFKPTSRHNVPSSSTHPNLEVKINKRHSGVSQTSSRWPYRLNFYERPPTLDITLDEFETFAIARLQVLSHIESLSHRNLPPAQVQAATAAYLKTHLPLSSNTARNVALDEERRKDEIGHWVLRLAFCRSPDLRSQFLRSETALFRHRFETDDVNERAAFLRSLEFDWQLVDESEKALYAVQLRSCLSGSTKEDNFKAESWFKVPWSTVPDLVATRQVFIKGGMAYVPQSRQISLVLQAFSTRLEKALELTAKNLPRLDEDERLGPVIDHLAASFLSGIAATEYQATGPADGSVVTAETVDEVARKHFPPCMRHLYDTLRKNRGLKHQGRLQLALFLKACRYLGTSCIRADWFPQGIGLPLNEAIVLWRKMYTQPGGITSEKWTKEYLYNIEHNYGKKGGMRNYTPRNCQQILTQNQPGSSHETHGCPFRHFSPDNLSNYLVATYPEIERSSPELRDIMDSVKSSHYHVACTRLFEATHGLKKGEGISKDGESVSHPNKYTDRSRELERETIDGIKRQADGDVSMDG
ncbi:DNA primase large subunit, partial [Tremellales sp. Uapishka_1]